MGICDVIFGKLIFATRWFPENIEFQFVNVQIQPCKFEPLESGNDSVSINLGYHTLRVNKKAWITISTTKESTIWMGESFWNVKSCRSKISNNNLVIKFIFEPCFFFFERLCLQFPFSQCKKLISSPDTDTNSCFFPSLECYGLQGFYRSENLQGKIIKAREFYFETLWRIFR